MGDYTKLIVNAEVRLTKQKLKKRLGELDLMNSGYHVSGIVVDMTKSTFDKNTLEFTLVCQTKYGIGQEDFLDWLEPYVTKGSGLEDIWAIQMDEYENKPTLRKKRKL